MAEEVKLFRTWTSPFALRVAMALKIKGIEYETIIEDLSNKSPLLLQYNPVHKQIPVLLHNGRSVCESLVILGYIDQTWKQNPLLPEDPCEKAMARFWAKFGDEKLLASMWKVFLKHGKEQDQAIVEALKNLEFMEKLIKEKKYFNGETIGYLDLAFCWMPNTVCPLEEISNLKLVDAERFPFLSAWMQNLLNDPSIKECWPSRDKLVTKYQAIREKYPPSSALN